MERVSAACAMEWSIELEKGLRSNKPGRPIDAILQVGPRLEQWSKDPSSTMTISSIFGLVPGEDRLFANTILLRLADAFKSGDKHTRACILKAFLLERRQQKKGKQYNGILSKDRVPNYVELLKRVKLVFDTGDIESRVIALRLLGCWSDIAKDGTEMRYMVLLGLGSSHLLEVKASIFAAGCFSESSKDFAYVFLEVLINMANSRRTPISVKLACAKAFAKLGNSFTLTTRGYKTGRELVLNSSEEDFVVEMLTSLSKLACKSSQLISEQVELLLSFIAHNSALRVQARAIRCMLFLLNGGVCRFPMNAGLLSQLFNVLNGTDLPTVPQCEILRILLKIFQSSEPSLSYIKKSEIVLWMPIVENATQSPIVSKRLLALRLLVNMSLNCKKLIKTVAGENGSIDLPSQVLLLVLDQMAQLVKTVRSPCQSVSDLTEECKTLLRLIIHVVEEHTALGFLALNRIRSCIESVVDLRNGGIGDKPASAVHEIVLLGGEKLCLIASQFVFCIYKFMEQCIEILNEANDVTAEVHHTVKLVSGILHKGILNHDMHTIYMIILHSRLTWSYLRDGNKEICDADDLDSSRTDCWIEHQRRTSEFLNEMIAGQDNWAAYSAGKYAACQGEWFAAAFMFRQLKERVHSSACQHWLKSLALFAGSESRIMLLSLPSKGQGLMHRSQMDEIWGTKYRLARENFEDAFCKAVTWDHCKTFCEAYSDVCSALEMLEAIKPADNTFIFQRWFLHLRAKFLDTVNGLLKILISYASNEESTCNAMQVDGYTHIDRMTPALDARSLSYMTIVLFRLRRLGQEFDLLATSFIDMDLKSSRIISRYALNCSLLAFSTGFAVCIPSLHSDGTSMLVVNDIKKCSHSMLAQDLFNRLMHIDSEMSTNLTRILTLIEEPNSCFHAPPRIPLYRGGQREKEIFDLCKFAVSGFLGMLEESKVTQDERGIYQDSRLRLQLLSRVIRRWMNTSFQVPKYFFQVRCCPGAELFIFNADTRNSESLSVVSGFHLPLNICIQLKHVPPGQVTKLHCILASKSSSYWKPGDEGKIGSTFQPNDTNDILDLSETLWMNVTEGVTRSGRKRGRGDGGWVWSYVSFELSERGQGFSSCLLDVSAFPVGSYRIKWHSCCIDSRDSYCSLVPLNMGPVFSVKK